MFDAARKGNTELLLQAVDAGLPANLMNDKGAAPAQSVAHARARAHPISLAQQ